MYFQVTIVTILLSTAKCTKTDKIVCYYMSSNGYSIAKPEDFDANLCTHLNYAFVNLNEDGTLKFLDKNLDIYHNLYTRVNALKEKNVNLKVLLSVAAPAKLFSAVARNSTKRSLFVESGRNYLETYGFDGLDIDWEKPYKNDKENFVNLLQDVRDDFNRDGWLLTVAVSAIPDAGYDVPEISKLVDIINVMSYDFYGPWSEYTGQNSALYKASIESPYQKKYLSVNATAMNWKNAGADPLKMCIGLAFYGRAFTLKDPQDNGLHAPITGAGKPKSPSFLQICWLYTSWTTIWDDEQKNSIKIKGDQWLGYDDEKSITLKVEYAMSNNYGGVMIWQIGSDDVHGKCGHGKQYLLNVINTVLKKVKF